MAIVKIIIADSDDGVSVTTELDKPLENDEDATPAHFVATHMMGWLDETYKNLKETK